MYKMVTCFSWNRPSSGNTEHQKYLEGLMQLYVFQLEMRSHFTKKI